MRRARAAQDARMEPGVDRQQWEAEMSAIEDQLGENPAESLPELDDLVRRVLRETGVEDPDVVAEYDAAHEITEALERGSDGISPGDVAAAINGYRAIFDAVVSAHDRAS
ncbi:MAG TPA: hypothetical protein VGH92_04130 [Gaiellaceae bacterium]